MLGLRSQGGSSLRVTGHGQYYHLWSTRSDVGQGVRIKGHVPTQNGLWWYYAHVDLSC